MNPNRRRVLIVDDDATIRETTAEILRLHGYLAHSANGGVAALHAIHTITPDIVITDYNMPAINGLGLLRHIKREHPLLPVIGMSGNSRNMKAFMSEGACAFLEKPVNTSLLLTVIAANLNKAAEAEQ